MSAAVALQFFGVKAKAILMSQLFGDERKSFFQGLRFALIEAAASYIGEVFHQFLAVETNLLPSSGATSRSFRWILKYTSATAPGIQKTTHEFRLIINRIDHRVGFRFRFQHRLSGRDTAAIVSITQDDDRFPPANWLQHMVRNIQHGIVQNCA